MVYLFYLLKEPVFSFIDLCYCFIFALIFMVSFLLLTLGFFVVVLVFLIALGERLLCYLRSFLFLR